MIKTTYQKPEIRDANDNIIQQGAFGKNTALANSTNDGWIDYVANDLEFLYDLAKDEIVPVPSLPASGQMNKTYLLTTTGVSYRWSGTEWVAVSSSEAVGRAETAATNAQNYANAAQQSADDAQDTADDIAEHLVQIDKNTGGVAKNSKRISNIEKLLQGNLYDYDTDDDVAYTKTVPSGALPYAGIEKLGGKTLVWNQLQGDITSYAIITGNDTGLTISVADGAITITGTASEDVSLRIIPSVSSVPANHKMLFRRTGSVFSWGRNGFTNQGDVDAFISTYRQAFPCGVKIYLTANTSYNFTSKFNMFDLTLMFGAGNEPSTVAEFEAMFPADYYPYNAGTLLSAGVTEVESMGKNLVPTYTESGSGNGLTWTANANGSLTINGTATADTFIRPAEYSTWTWDGVTPCWLSGCPVSGSTTKYHLRLDTAEDVLARAVPDYGNGRELSDNSSSHPIQGLPLRFCIVVRSGQVLNNIIFYPMLEYGTAATSYSPYVESSFPIPAEVRALEGYGWSAGTAYNYVDFERKVFVQNVGRVDLGTLNWTHNTSQERFSSLVTSMALPIDSAGRIDGIICKLYVPSIVVINNPLNVDMAMARYTDGKIYIRNSAYTDATTFKAAMSGVYLYYELATPVETDISAYLTDDNLVEVESGGTLTMYSDANGDDDAYHIPVPSTVEYMIDLNVATGGTENEP